MKRVGVAVLACLILSLAAHAGHYLTNDTGVDAAGLRIVFSEPVSIDSFGDAFTQVSPTGTAREFIFSGGVVTPWGGVWFNQTPTTATIERSEWFAGSEMETASGVTSLADSTQQLSCEEIMGSQPFVSWCPDAERLLDATQASTIPLFKTGRFHVNRLTTARVRIVFLEVETLRGGSICTAAYTGDGIAALPACPGGSIVRAAAILVSGMANGRAEIAFAYEAADGGSRGAETLALWAYVDGTWSDASGTWMLEGGSWQALTTCIAPSSQVVIAEVAVSLLLGRANAIVLVAEAGS